MSIVQLGYEPRLSAHSVNIIGLPIWLITPKNTIKKIRIVLTQYYFTLEYLVSSPFSVLLCRE